MHNREPAPVFLYRRSHGVNAPNTDRTGPPTQDQLQRLAPYIRETSTLQEAIRLYRRNIDLSGAVYEALHVHTFASRLEISIPTDRSWTISI
jgi:hypothetical protein